MIDSSQRRSRERHFNASKLGVEYDLVGINYSLIQILLGAAIQNHRVIFDINAQQGGGQIKFIIRPKTSAKQAFMLKQ